MRSETLIAAGPLYIYENIILSLISKLIYLFPFLLTILTCISGFAVKNNQPLPWLS